MAVVVDVDLTGAPEIARLLREIDERFRRGVPRSVLDRIGSRMAAAFRSNIESGGERVADRGVRWPPLSPATLESRRRSGRGDRPLIRTGAMLGSIEVIDVTGTSVSVGPRADYAGYVHQRRPFNLPSFRDVNDWTGLLADHFVPRS